MRDTALRASHQLYEVMRGSYWPHADKEYGSMLGVMVVKLHDSPQCSAHVRTLNRQKRLSKYSVNGGFHYQPEKGPLRRVPAAQRNRVVWVA